MKRNGPRPVGELIDRALPQLRERLLEIRIRRAWSALVGADLARRARPGTLAGGTLDVVVDNSPWLHELTLRGPDLARAVRGRFPEVASLRFTLGTVPAGDDDDGDVPTSRATRRPPLTETDRRDIDRAVATIPDPALAAAARRLMTRARPYRRDATASLAGETPARRAEQRFSSR